MKQAIIIFVIIAFAVGFYHGFKYQSVKNSGIPNTLPLSCVYNNNTYKHGDQFKSVDGCNGCVCENGQVSCTEMACLTN